MNWILYNGKIVKEHSLKLEYTSNWAKFAPGFFETMKVYQNTILFWEDHYKRMALGAKFWKVKIPKKKELEKQLLQLIKKNKLNNARLRIQFNASLESNWVDYFATTFPLKESDKYIWIKKGWKLGVYKENRKSYDGTGFKSNNRNIYLLGKKWATSNGFNDALILNAHNRITDSTSCSLFWVKDEKVFTPPIASGAVDGTFARFLKQQQQTNGIKIEVKKCSLKDLKKADEIFLTNVIRGVRWVCEFEGKAYSNEVSKKLFKQLKSWERRLSVVT